MAFLRAVVMLVFAATSTWVFAEDNRASASNLPFVTDSPPTLFVKPSPDHAEPWFSGMQGVIVFVQGSKVTVTPGSRSGNVCLTMRTYKVARTERLADNDSGNRGYSTCQMTSNYHVRTTGRMVVSVPEQ